MNTPGDLVYRCRYKDANLLKTISGWYEATLGEDVVDVIRDHCIASDLNTSILCLSQSWNNRSRGAESSREYFRESS